MQGLAKGLGVSSRVISPTFILMRSYKIGRSAANIRQRAASNLYHVDLYRLEGDPQGEVENLGLSEIWNDRKNVVVIEWAEKIRESLPPKTIWIEFNTQGEKTRKIVVTK